MNRGVAVLAVAVAMMSLAGCEQITGARQETQLVATREPIVTDIPVPEGFKMDLQKSFYSAPAGAAVRRGKLTYTGRARKEDLITFFRESMPVSGWTMTHEGVDFASYVMRFDKGAEAAEVVIMPGSLRTDVTVLLGRAGKE